MVNFTILAGGYATFVASYLLNTDSSTLTLLHQSPTGQDPSWIALHPTNHSILYAVNEIDQGAIQSFTVGFDGQLSGPVGQASSGGNGPAHLQPLDTGEVSIMNYGSGNGRVIATSDDPAVLIDDGEPLITFPADVSHPHETVDLGSELLVPDLGADKIWRLVKNNASGDYEIIGEIAQPAGSGPRRVIVNDGILFTLHETASTLTAQPLPAAPNGTAPITSSVSTIPASAPAGATFGAAELLIPPPTSLFPTPFIYVSNRNVSPDPALVDARGDTIAVFSYDSATGALTLEAQVFTGLQQVRGMAFSEDAQYLVAGGVVGTGGVAVFERADGGKDLREVARNVDVPTRTSFVWV